MNTETTAARAAWSMARRNWLLLLLCATGLVNMLDRQIISILLQPIKQEFAASDTVMGLLTGPIFAGFFALAAIPVARSLDVYPRKVVLAACITFWSLMTSLGGLAQSFVQLALTRIGVAVAEAGGAPASHSMAADLYPLRRRGLAIATISAAQSLGIGLGVFLGGWLTEAFGSWRTSFMIVGLPGIILAVVLLFSVREPPRGMSDNLSDDAPAPKFFATFAELWGLLSFRCMFLVTTFGGIGGYGFLNWGPTFLRRVHHMTGSQVGTWFGLTVAAALITGNMMGGYLGDRFGRRNLTGYLWVCGAGPLLAVSAGMVFLFSHDWRVAIVGLFLYQGLLTTHIPSAYTMGQTLAPLRMRATASVILNLGSALVGTAVAPLIIGALNDLLAPRLGDESIRYSMSIVAVFPLLACACAWLAIRWVRSDYARSHGREYAPVDEA